MENEIFEELLKIKSRGLFRSLRLVESEQSSEIILNGKRVILFCSNNYLGLANSPELKKASIEATEKYGTSSGASRLVSGNMTIHEELESRIAKFKGTESALLFNSGYHANLGIIPAIAKGGDLILSDELNHATIIDGTRLSRAEVVVYPHLNLNFVEDTLKKSRHRRKLIVTDGIFSMDGDIAPLKELVELKEKYNAVLMVDEAHATGVIGTNGRGIVEHLGLTGRVDIIMGTLGKALGSFGAFAATTKVVREYLINTARSLIFSTSLPPSVCGAAIKAIELLEAKTELTKQLNYNVEYFKNRLKEFYPDIKYNTIPIIPLITGDTNETMRICEELLKKGIFIQGIRPPSVPEGTSRLRLTITAQHTEEQMDKALTALKETLKTERKIYY